MKAKMNTSRDVVENIVEKSRAALEGHALFSLETACRSHARVLTKVAENLVDLASDENAPEVAKLLTDLALAIALLRMAGKSETGQEPT